MLVNWELYCWTFFITNSKYFDLKWQWNSQFRTFYPLLLHLHIWIVASRFQHTIKKVPRRVVISDPSPPHHTIIQYPVGNRFKQYLLHICLIVYANWLKIVYNNYLPLSIQFKIWCMTLGVNYFFLKSRNLDVGKPEYEFIIYNLQLFRSFQALKHSCTNMVT